MISILSISFCVFVLDRISKSIVVQKLSISESLPLIPDIFHITLVHNKGAAFGLMQNATLFFVLISAICIIVILYYLFLKPGVYAKSLLIKIAMGFILAGAFGNLIDRLKFGYVIDFLDFRIWPVFNIADSAITIGTILLVIKFLTASNKKSS